MKLKHLIVVLFLVITSVAYSQGTLKGKITDTTAFALPFVNIVILKGNIQIGAIQTNGSGKFEIDSIPVGKYDVVASSLGYAKFEKKQFSIKKGITILNIQMKENFTNINNTDVVLDVDIFAEDDVSIIESRIEVSESNKDVAKVVSSKDSRFTRKSSKIKTEDEPEVFTIVKQMPDQEEVYYKIIEEDSVSASYHNPLAHLLTAGEVNDFTKWVLWNDIDKTDLAEFAKTWNLFPKNRYCVQLTNKLLNPVVDATVELKDKNKKTIWTAKTDNTGKAELWSNLFDLKIKEEESYSIEITYQGQKQVIKKAIPFHKEVNNLKLEVDCNYSNNVDVMFVVDATGSMGDEIDYLKAELLDIINNVKKQDSSLIINLGSVFYRDKGDQYVTRKSDFSRTIQQTIDFINNQEAGGGGDYEEAVDVALNEAITQCNWSNEARTRILFLVLDAPPHGDSGVVAQLQQLMNTAAQKGIRIIPIMGSGIGKSTEYLFRSMALATNGTYTFLTDDSGIGGPHIKPTTDTYKVELLNDMMLRLFKQYTSIPVCNKPVEFVPAELIPDTNFLTPIIDTTITKDTTSLVLKQDTSKTQVPIVEVKPTWKCYPNPTTGMLTVEINGNLVDLFITDNSGKILEKVDAHNGDKTMQIDLSNYPNGIYFVRYYYGIDQSVTAKIILTR